MCLIVETIDKDFLKTLKDFTKEWVELNKYYEDMDEYFNFYQGVKPDNWDARYDKHFQVEETLNKLINLLSV